MLPPIVPFVLAALVVALVAVAAARALVIAQPDEWLLCIRDGKLIDAGVGIHVWRRPGDVVARFTSTMQRVGFDVAALSAERLPVAIEGFILWSVAPDGDAPFRAFRKLGLVNLAAPPRELANAKHLLTTPQHRAFQQLLGASVQRLAATHSLDDLLARQDELVGELRGQLAALEQDLGIRLDRIEIVRVRPVDEELVRKMSAEVEARLREDAATIALQAGERAKRRAIESDARIAHEQAEARRQELGREQALELARIALDREQALAVEARTAELAAAVREREELELAARLDRIRREAEANRDAMAAIAEAEERKSQAVRDHEVARLVADRVGDALEKLPLKEAKWVTVGADSPVGSLAALLTAALDGKKAA